MDQSGHTLYQIKAEFYQLSNGILYIVNAKEFKIIITKE